MLLFLLTLVALATSSAPPRLSTSLKTSQLSKDIAPTAYKLEIKLEKDFFTTKVFSGKTTITLKTADDAIPNTFQFHAKELTFTSKTLKEGLNDIEADFSDPDPDTDLVTVTLKDNLKNATVYTLTIEYNGKMDDQNMVGLYSSSYVDEFGIEKHMAVTQFEEIHARRAFPCFDEPQFLSTFSYYLTFPEGLHAWSALAMGSETVRDGLVSVHTVITKKALPTYLTAFIIAPFLCKKADPTTTTTIQLCSKISPIDNSAKTALDAVTNLTLLMSSYTGEEYTEKFLTLAAIPDLAPGAMENYALITFKESNILWNEDLDTTYDKQRVVTTLAHELSHQWFGDLVFMEWWGEMFLKEGIATYFQYFLPDQLESTKNWDLAKQFSVEQTQSALVNDALDNALPLSYDVTDPDYSNRVNDLSYTKGASIVRMVHQIMGLDAFKLGLTDYITNHKGGSATSEDLWISFDAQSPSLPSDTNMSTVMGNWIKEPHYPLVNVKTDGDKVVLSQEEFTLSGGSGSTQWYIPITYAKKGDSVPFSDTTTKVWLQPGKKVTVQVAADDWIVFNVQQSGYYRVNYDEESLQRTLKAFNGSTLLIDEVNRAQIIDDLFFLARAGKKNYSDVLDYVEGALTLSYVPMKAFFNNFEYFFQRVGNDNVRDAIKAFVFDLLDPYKRAAAMPGAIPATHTYLLYTQLTQKWLCKLGDESCLSLAREQFQNYTQSVKPLPDRRSIVYCYGATQPSDFQLLYLNLLAETNANERQRLLKAMACPSAYHGTYLLYALQDKEITLEESEEIFRNTYSLGPEGVTSVLDLIIGYHSTFERRFGDFEVLKTLLNSLAKLVTREDQVNKMTKFSQIKDLDDDVRKAADKAVEEAGVSLAKAQALEEDLGKHFDVDVGPTKSGGFRHFLGTACLVFIVLLWV